MGSEWKSFAEQLFYGDNLGLNSILGYLETFSVKEVSYWQSISSNGI